jgi:hypothetical protein
MRRRPAPIAARILNSFCRVEALASSRFAIFTQAISSSKITAASSTIRACRDFPTSFSCRGMTTTFVSGIAHPGKALAIRP